MTDNEQNLIAAYRRLYDAISDAVEDDKYLSGIGEDVTNIMTGPLGDEVRRLEALVQTQEDC